MESTATLGFLGTGAIAEAMVTGLCAGRSGSNPLRILVSRRNQARSARLQQRFPAVVKVVDDNQEIVDRSAVPVVSVLPAQAEALLTGLRFRADHKVLSLVAGLRLGRLRALVAPSTRVFRALPMPPVERGLGPVPLSPPDDRLAAVLGRLGAVISVDDERQFQAMAATTALMASYFEIVAATAQWLEGEAVPPAAAARYATSLFVALSSVFDGVDPSRLASLSSDCLTVGGLNQQVLTELRDGGWFVAVRGRLDRIMARLDGM